MSVTTQNITKPKFILLDIEGTTTSISFVHDVLFPYSYERMSDFIRGNAHQTEVKKAVSEVREIVEREEGRTSLSQDEIIQRLKAWIREDRKIPPLKAIQGMIWELGYENSDYRSHLYEDVFESLKAWKKAGVEIGIYSSGSVRAQKLLFRYTVNGDVTPFLSFFFDTQVGAKREEDSYRKISQDLQASPHEILFLSDVPQELDAASAVGFLSCLVVREGGENLNHPHHKVIQSFDEIQF